MRKLSFKQIGEEKHVWFDLWERDNPDTLILPHQIKFARWRAVANQLKKQYPDLRDFLEDATLQSVGLQQFLGSLLSVALVFQKSG